jgi:acyl dehydratase
VTWRYEVEAYNTATSSSNKIHDDDVAREYGFRGGLVPGVDVYAYMTHVPASLWGLQWLGGGSMSARFVRPVYDGERVAITGEQRGHELMLELTGADGVVRAMGTAALGAPVADNDEVPRRAPVPADRPSASAESLSAGTVLGSLDAVFDAAKAADYLAAVRERLPLYTDAAVAHPGWLLRFANTVLASSVVLGPWIHVSSDVALLGAVGDGETLDVRGEVVAEYERSGHRFVELDVAVTAGDRVVQRVAHTAIHTPRRLTHSTA